MPALPSPLSVKAKELALDLGAEAVVILVLRPNESGDGWNSEQSAYLQTETGLDWEILSQALSDASEDCITQPVIQDEKPS